MKRTHAAGGPATTALADDSRSGGAVWGKRRVLLLNATYEPLTAISMRRAIVLMLRDRADVVHDDPNGPLVHSADRSLSVPSVIRLRTLPFTWIGYSTDSCTSSAGSATGQSASAMRLVSPSAAQASSAMCGTIGETRRISVLAASARAAEGFAFSMAFESS